MKCKSCGTDNREQARFCKSCRAQIGGSSSRMCRNGHVLERGRDDCPHCGAPSPGDDAARGGGGTIIPQRPLVGWLVVVKGKGMQFRVDYRVVEGRNTIGRAGRGAMIGLDDPEVSVRHAILEHGGGDCRLTDDASQNGTAVNGRALAPHETVGVRTGDRITLGGTVLVFCSFPYAHSVGDGVS